MMRTVFPLLIPAPSCADAPVATSAKAASELTNFMIPRPFLLFVRTVKPIHTFLCDAIRHRHLFAASLRNDAWLQQSTAAVQVTLPGIASLPRERPMYSRRAFVMSTAMSIAAASGAQAQDACAVFTPERQKVT